MTERERFEKWFKEPLESLYENEHAGFAILMIALPVLERHLRWKSGENEKTRLDPNGPFYDELIKLFPTLGSRAIANDFWESYRHGLLHQATLKNKAGTAETSVKNDPTAPAITVSICSGGRQFVVAPVVFSKKVIDEIQSDFSTFLGAASVKQHPFSDVAITHGTSGVRNI